MKNEESFTLEPTEIDGMGRQRYEVVFTTSKNNIPCNGNIGTCMCDSCFATRHDGCISISSEERMKRLAAERKCKIRLIPDYQLVSKANTIASQLLSTFGDNIYEKETRNKVITCIIVSLFRQITLVQNLGVMPDVLLQQVVEDFAFTEFAKTALQGLEKGLYELDDFE